MPRRKPRTQVSLGAGAAMRELEMELRDRWRQRQPRRWNPQERDDRVAIGHQEGGHDGEDATWGPDTGR
jgi:hypothetical protein